LGAFGSFVMGLKLAQGGWWWKAAA
jgi:hypothetical protein